MIAHKKIDFAGKVIVIAYKLVKGPRLSHLKWLITRLYMQDALDFNTKAKLQAYNGRALFEYIDNSAIQSFGVHFDSRSDNSILLI